MSLISVNNLTFGYEAAINNVFENVSFNLDTDWRLGLIGRNGRGKTTLLKLLMGEYEYKGNISKKVEFEYFPFIVDNKSRMAIEIVNEITPSAEDWEIMKELSLLDADADILYRNFDLLSGGEQVKILIVSLFLKENTFLLIDEPTNHLDSETKNNLEKYLKKKKGFILVSHDRSFLDKCVDHIISINNNSIDIQKGNFSSWQENKSRRDNFELNQNERLKKDIARLKTAAENSSDWSDKTERSKFNATNSGSSIDRGYVGHKSAKMMKKSKALEKRIEKAIEEKSGLLKNIDNEDALKIIPSYSRHNPLITASDFQIKYDNKAIFDSVTFEIKNGDRIALSGKNGSGKSSILKLITGEDIQFSGIFKIAGGLKISYVPQCTDGLEGNIRKLARLKNIDESVFITQLAKMGFSDDDFNKNAEELSEGQKKKVLLAESISQSADIYIWDEPLNYIDVLTRIQLENAVLKYCPTLIFVEHDAKFVNTIADRIINLSQTRVELNSLN